MHSEPRLNPENLMIVENESIIAKDLEYSLRRLGWNTKVIAHTAREAVDMACEHQPDLILMDIKLGGKEDGVDVAAEIARFSDVPIIYLTAYADPDTLNRAKQTHPYGYIIKPFDERTLQVTIDMALFKHRTAKKLKEKDIWLNRVVGNLTEGLVAADNRMMMRFMNPAASNMIERSADEAIGKPLWEILEILDAEQKTRGNLFRLGCSLDEMNFPEGKEYILVGRSGKTRLVECRCVAMSPSGEVAGDVLLVLTDITRRKELERQLRQSQKLEAIGALASGVAHDFNNVLTVILGYSEMTMRDLPEHSPNRIHMEHVFTAAERARDLVKQILTFSRQSGQEKSPVQVSLIVKEAMKLIRSSLPSTVEIRTRIQAAERLVMSDPTQIHQIVMNLCINAAYAMKEHGGLLDVELQDAEWDGKPMVRLKVSDNGVGMTEDVMTRIFEPFFTTKPPGEGAGLGLAMIHGIVSAHGGSISVKSQPGNGAEFVILLPRLTEPESVKRHMEASPGDITGHESILLADDEPMIAELCRTQLEDLGYRVTVFHGGRDALAYFKLYPLRFDLLITDLTMPQLPGLELVKEIRAVRRDMPVIVITGFRSKELAEQCKAMEINLLLTKPLDSRKLGESVRYVLDGVSAGG